MSVIRSTHERRILDWLADSSGTVSEVAGALKMRVPHASAAFKKLRQKGYVVRDLDANIRGAVHRLTESGTEKLMGDALSRAIKFCQEIPKDMDGVILAREGKQLLLGYTKHKHNGLISLPKYSFSNESSDLYDSSGTEGAGWVVTRGAGMLWYNLDTLEKVEPLERNSQSIVNWSDNSRTIGIVRARMIGDESQIMMPVGTWFEQPMSLPELPELISDPEYIIGTSGLDDVEVSIPMNTQICIKSKVNKEILLNQISNKTFSLTLLPKASAPHARPIGCVYHWLRKQHPRIGQNKISEYFQNLSKLLLQGDLSKISANYRKKLLADFGTSYWIDDTEVGQGIALNGLSVDGGECVWRWAINSSFSEISGEWPWDNRPDLKSLILSSGKLRAIVVESAVENDEQVNCTITDGSDLGYVMLTFLGDNQIPVSLKKERSQEKIESGFSKIPASAIELITLPSERFTGVAIDMDEKRKLSQALTKYPLGDSKWSNENEGMYPLASWIASPPSERQLRWQRIKHRLPENWAGLLDIDITDTLVLLESIERSESVWKNMVKQELSQRFTFNPDEMSGLIDHLENSSYSSILSTSILLASSGLGKDWDDLIAKSVEVWVEQPRDTFPVLESLFSNSDILQKRSQIFSQVKKTASMQNTNSQLWVWYDYISKVENDVPLLANEARKVMETLPETWWSNNAKDWLLMQLGATQGRRWLAANAINWPVQIFRQEGERVSLPGLNLEHLGHDLTKDMLLDCLLVPQGIGQDYILDLFECVQTIEDGMPIHSGRTHPLVGLLGRPVQSWPRYDRIVFSSGNEDTTDLLLGIRYKNRFTN